MHSHARASCQLQLLDLRAGVFAPAASTRVDRARVCSGVLLCRLSVAATRPPREYEQPHRTLTLKCDVGLRSQNVTSLPH